MFDAHAHLQDPRLAACRDAARTAAALAGVTGICCCATAPTDWAAVAALTHQPSTDPPLLLLPAFGVHPWFAAPPPDEWTDALDALLLQYPQAVVGECGLDGIRDDVPRERQREALVRQLTLAVRHERPVVLHGARAWGALLDTVRSFAGRLPALVAHSFGSSHEILRDWLALGGFVSFSGILCNRAATRVRAAAAATPDDRLLVETDAPDFFPVGGLPCPGHAATTDPRDPGPNHPANLAVVLTALAEIRNVPVDTLATLTASNARRAFGLID